MYTQVLFFLHSFLSSGGALPEAAYGTSAFFLFFDKLFDSSNSHRTVKWEDDDNYKELRQDYSDSLPQKSFMNDEALPVLRSITFNTEKGRYTYS